MGTLSAIVDVVIENGNAFQIATFVLLCCLWVYCKDMANRLRRVERKVDLYFREYG